MFPRNVTALRADALFVSASQRSDELSHGQIRQAVADHSDGRWLGFFGEPRVNVVELNLELDQKYPAKS